MLFEQSRHKDPHSLPFHALPKSSGAPWKVQLLHCGFLHSERMYWSDDAWDKDERRREAKRQSPYSLPITYALVSRGDQTYFWDLGYDPDNDRLPKILGRPDLPRDCTPIKMLDKLGIDPSQEKKKFSIIWSHCHVDHYGKLDDFPTSVPVYVGEGSLDWVNGGDEAEGGLAGFPTAYLKGGWKFHEIGDSCSLKKTSVGPFPEAWDFAGDQSMYLVKTPGHCPAHQSLLVKCNEEGDWILLGGDVAHAQDLYWHEDLVKPYSLEQDRRSVPGQFKFTPEDTEWSCMQDFPDLAFGTLSGLARFEMEPNVIVLPAHEVEAIDAAGLQPGGVHDLTNWRKDGLKEKKHELGRQRAERLSQL